MRLCALEDVAEGHLIGAFRSLSVLYFHIRRKPRPCRFCLQLDGVSRSGTSMDPTLFSTVYSWSTSNTIPALLLFQATFDTREKANQACLVPSDRSGPRLNLPIPSILDQEAIAIDM